MLYLSSKIKKYKWLPFYLFTLPFLAINKVYAQERLLSDESPSAESLLVPIKRVVNAFLLTSGAVFVMLVFVASYKYATSQGDPKAMQGAKQTLTYAILGFVLVISAFTILNITVLGLGVDPSYGTSGGLFTRMQDALNELVGFANVGDH